MTKHNLVGLKELRVNLDKYVRGVERGSSYTVLRRSKPVFRISPVETEDEAGWDTIFDANRDNKGKGIRAGEILRILRKIDKHGSKRKAAPKTR